MPRRVRIILQARTGSSRLPAKSLLPIERLPLAMACAKRLGSSGREVVLATSNDRSDDLLASIATEYGIRVYRGSLEDVRGRFLGCMADLADDDVVVRATADNPVPDGEFVEELIRVFEQLDCEYLGTSSPIDGLPYGLSAEVFTAGALRQAAAETDDPHDREHVTPRLRAKVGPAGIVPRGLFLSTDCSSLRVTIDTLEDYLAVASAFRGSSRGEAASWREVVEAMPCQGAGNTMIPSTTVESQRYGCITLGTAQLGSHYGITNRTGRPLDGEVREILAAAIAAGVTHIDTARAYGDAESRIGHLTPSNHADTLRIITKLPPLADLPDDASVRDVHNAVDARVFGSCRDLGRRRIDVLMFHRSGDMFRWGGAAMERLAAHMESGVIADIGVSVYEPNEAVRCLEDPRVSHFQIPFNVLDGRWLAPYFQQALASRSGRRIHVRSVFLQGLLLSDVSEWPQWVSEAPSLVKRLRTWTQSLGRKNVADLCIGYVRAFGWVTSLVLGVEMAAQLRELVELARERPLTSDEAVAVGADFADVPARLLNPSLW